MNIKTIRQSMIKRAAGYAFKPLNIRENALKEFQITPEETRGLGILNSLAQTSNDAELTSAVSKLTPEQLVDINAANNGSDKFVKLFNNRFPNLQQSYSYINTGIVPSGEQVTDWSNRILSLIKATNSGFNLNTKKLMDKEWKSKLKDTIKSHLPTAAGYNPANWLGIGLSHANMPGMAKWIMQNKGLTNMGLGLLTLLLFMGGGSSRKDSPIVINNGAQGNGAYQLPLQYR